MNLLKELESDVWDMRKVIIDEHRNNPSSPIGVIRFTDINCFGNKLLLKKYAQCLVNGTTLSMSTIKSKIMSIKQFLLYIYYKEISEITRSDITNYMQLMTEKHYKNATFNKSLYANMHFFEFCEQEDKIDCKHIYLQDIRPNTTDYEIKIIDDTTIGEIFRILPKVPFELTVMFLLLYCTGMRISEVCALKKDAVYHLKDKAFIRFYQQKMKKEVTNPIPKNLSKLIKAQIALVSGNNRVFVADRGGHYQSSMFRVKMNRLMRKFDIKNEDGSEYFFRAHAYRHNFAAGLIKNDVSLVVVSKLLHHLSLEMTLSYAKVTDKRRLQKYTEFVNAKGDVSPLPQNIQTEWLKNNILAQTLPNGLCVLPVKLGNCPNCNACLNCDYFRTSKKFLNVIEVQLLTTENMISSAKANNWLPQLETNMILREKLVKIVENLKDE